MSNIERFIGQYGTVTFGEAFPTSTQFSTEFKASAYYSLLGNEFTDTSINLVYYLLLAKYEANPTANQDVSLFKNKLFSIIFKYGPTWQKKLEIQKKLRTLTESDIILGTTTIYNRASNPEQAPTTDTIDELTYINDQNTQKFKRNKTSAYSELYSLLRDNITDAFIDHFKVCFRMIVAFDYFVPVYEEEEDET